MKERIMNPYVNEQGLTLQATEFRNKVVELKGLANKEHRKRRGLEGCVIVFYMIVVWMIMESALKESVELTLNSLFYSGVAFVGMILLSQMAIPHRIPADFLNRAERNYWSHSISREEAGLLLEALERVHDPELPTVKQTLQELHRY